MNPAYLSLPLIQVGQLSVIGEMMCTKYWLTRASTNFQNQEVQDSSYPNLEVRLMKHQKNQLFSGFKRSYK